MDPVDSPETLPTADPQPAAISDDPITGQFSSLNDLCPELSSLHDLACRGSYRSILDKVHRAKKLPNFLPLPHHRLTYLAYHLLALSKLRRYPDAQTQLESILPLDSPIHTFQHYPHLYTNLSGSFIPFSLRWLHALLPDKLGRRHETLDRLYSLLHFVQTKLLKRSPNASASVSNELWRKREAFVINSIISQHLTHKEFSVCLDLIQRMLHQNGGESRDAVLLSKLGYVRLQLGDLEGAKGAFDEVEELVKEKKDQSLNLVGRNKALVYLVGKDYMSAVREYEECIDRDGSDVVAVNNKAICLMYLRELSGSISVLESALERVPTVALNETLVVNLCSMYELAYVNHSDIKRTLSNWIARVAPDDFDTSCTRV